MDGEFYTAIRIPEAGKSFRAKRMVSEGRASATEGREAREHVAWRRCALRSRTQMPVDDVLDALEEYDHLITPDRPPTSDHLLRKTLEARAMASVPVRHLSDATASRW